MQFAYTFINHDWERGQILTRNTPNVVLRKDGKRLVVLDIIIDTAKQQKEYYFGQGYHMMMYMIMESLEWPQVHHKHKQ